MKIGILVRPFEHIFTSGCAQQFYFILNLLRNCEFEVNFLTRFKNFSRFDLTNERLIYIDETFDFKDIDIILYGNDIFNKITDKNIINQIISQNTKLIHCICGNYYHLYHEFLIFNVHDTMFEILNSYQDEIWVLEIYKGQTSFLELLFQVPVTIMPYVWTPYFVDKYISLKDLQFLDKLQYVRNDKINICIFEPNVSTHKSCFIPFLIANMYYKMYKDRVNKVFVFCSNENIQKRVAPFDIVREQKTEFLGKLVMLETMNIIRNNNDYLNIVISHNIKNPLNFIHLEFLHLGIPLIHNSKAFQKNNLYYKHEMDAVPLIEQTRLTFNFDTYKELGKDIIDQFSENNPTRVKEYSYQSHKIISNN